MSGGFTDAERDRIREGLLAAGREQFVRYGLGKTTIAELTDAVGIADSTFYRFFDSKEALYLEILDREGERLVPELLAPLEEHDDPERAIAAFLRRVMDEIETNPLVERLLVDPADRERLRAHQDDPEADRQGDVAYFLPYVEAWFEAGDLRGPDPETVAHAVRAVTMLTLHREDVGRERYPAVRDLVVDAVAAGLTRPD
jgi:AcrR family transcriptional regulator